MLYNPYALGQKESISLVSVCLSYPKGCGFPKNRVQEKTVKPSLVFLLLTCHSSCSFPHLRGLPTPTLLHLVLSFQNPLYLFKKHNLVFSNLIWSEGGYSILSISLSKQLFISVEKYSTRHELYACLPPNETHLKEGYLYLMYKGQLKTLIYNIPRQVLYRNTKLIYVRSLRN